MPGTMENRAHNRKAPKILEDNHVTYQTVSEHPVITGQGSLMDISENGCRVRDVHRLKRGLRIRVALPNEQGQPSTILTNCQVAWVQESEFGVQFLW